MKKVRLLLLLVVLVVAMTLAGCANVDLNKGQQGALGGALGGALLGQAIGGDTEATLIGTAVGGLLGYIVGNEMDKFDRRNVVQAVDKYPSGKTRAWSNPDSGNYYEVTPEPAYRPAHNPQQVCRNATILAQIDGKAKKTQTTACRDERGAWVLQ